MGTPVISPVSETLIQLSPLTFVHLIWSAGYPVASIWALYSSPTLALGSLVVVISGFCCTVSVIVAGLLEPSEFVAITVIE